MMGTFNCTYETPCGWCIKWDKKCDRKVGNQPLHHGAYKDLFDCTHEWEPTNSSGAYMGVDGKSKVYTTYICKLCGATKNE